MRWTREGFVALYALRAATFAAVPLLAMTGLATGSLAAAPRVSHYDRDGKRIEEFGSTASRTNADGFGGCCNPMNVCFGPQGQVFTAESEGIIRRFSPRGEYLGLVGRVTLTGGCKNVALSATADGERIYFCDLPNSRIIVMGPVTNEAEAEALAVPPKPTAAELAESEDDDAEEADDASSEEEDAP